MVTTRFACSNQFESSFAVPLFIVFSAKGMEYPEQGKTAGKESAHAAGIPANTESEPEWEKL